MLAAANGLEAVVKILLEANAELEKADNDGWTALMWAAAKGQEAVVNLLQEAMAVQS